MKISTVHYHKVFNLGDYENEKISLEATLEEGESHVEAIAKLKEEVQKAHDFSSQLPQYMRAQRIANSPFDHTGRQVEGAKEAIKTFEEKYPDYIETYKAKLDGKLIESPVLNDVEHDELPY